MLKVFSKSNPERLLLEFQRPMSKIIFILFKAINHFSRNNASKLFDLIVAYCKIICKKFQNESKTNYNGEITVCFK